jgi:hypothetical protein
MVALSGLLLVDHGMLVAVWPAEVISITPAQAHMHLDTLSSAGALPTFVVAAPGAHGAVVFGMQGIGVYTPNAAAVAAATVGLASDWHMPNGMILVMGT